MRERLIAKKTFDAILDGRCTTLLMPANDEHPIYVGDQFKLSEIDPDKPDPRGHAGTLLSGNFCQVACIHMQRLPGTMTDGTLTNWYACSVTLTAYHFPHIPTIGSWIQEGRDIPQA